MNFSRIAFSILAVLIGTVSSLSSNNFPDSIQQLIHKATNDSAKVNEMLALSKFYFSSDPDKAIQIANEALEISSRIQFKKGRALAYKNLGIAYYNQSKYVETLNNWQNSLSIYESVNDKAGVANILSNMGAIYFNQGDDAKALEYYLKSLKPAEEIKDTLRIVTALINIGAVYFNKPATHQRALEYYERALPLCIAIEDKEAIGMVTVNLGEIYFEKKNYERALDFFNQSVRAFAGSENTPYSLNNIGKVYAEMRRYDDAIKYHEEALEAATKLESKNDMALIYLGIAQTLEKKGDVKKSLENYIKARDLASETNATYQLKDIYQGMALAYSELKDFGNAFKYQSLLIALKDTIYNINTDKKLGTLSFNYEIEKKESQINLLTKDQEIKEQIIQKQKLVRNGFIGGFTVVMVFAGIFFMQRNRISKEKKRSDELLLNILPEETAEELKATGSAKAKSFDSVSVLFTDFKNFTQASEILSPEELVAEINYCYSEFDKIITSHKLEKIKTIGDAYMCAGGLPAASNTHPIDIVSAGLAMVDFIEKNKQHRISQGKPYFELRCGIHTGPVVAGVVGTKKFAYDIWGDTVNTASRMESSGEVGRVNISGATFELVKNKFACTHRGKVKAKNKGEIDMYFVDYAI